MSSDVDRVNTVMLSNRDRLGHPLWRCPLNVPNIISFSRLQRRQIVPRVRGRGAHPPE